MRRMILQAPLLEIHEERDAGIDRNDEDQRDAKEAHHRLSFAGVPVSRVQLHTARSGIFPVRVACIAMDGCQITSPCALAAKGPLSRLHSESGVSGQ